MMLVGFFSCLRASDFLRPAFDYGNASNDAIMFMNMFERGTYVVHVHYVVDGEDFVQSGDVQVYCMPRHERYFGLYGFWAGNIRT